MSDSSLIEEAYPPKSFAVMFGVFIAAVVLPTLTFTSSAWYYSSFYLFMIVVVCIQLGSRMDLGSFLEGSDFTATRSRLVLVLYRNRMCIHTILVAKAYDQT